MALPSNVGFGTVTGRFVDSTGTALEGVIEFVPSPKRLSNATAAGGPVTILPKVVRVTLAEGAFSQQLIATDDPDNNPTGWTYEAKFSLTGVKVDPFSFSLPEDTTVDLALAAPAATSNGVQTVRGPGVVAGGTTGQVLIKKSGTDFDTEWATVSGTGAPAVGLGDDVPAATFWGVFTAATAPTPPNDGGVHYGFLVES